jgi:hypothetical protein
MKRAVAAHRKSADEIILAPLAETEGLANKFHKLVSNEVEISLSIRHIGIIAVFSVGADYRDFEVGGVSLNIRLSTPARVIIVHTVKQPKHGDLFLIAAIRNNDVYRRIVIKTF